MEGWKLCAEVGEERAWMGEVAGLRFGAEDFSGWGWGWGSGLGVYRDGGESGASHGVAALPLRRR